MRGRRKNYALIFFLILMIGAILYPYIPKQEAAADEPIKIPNEAIRLRILANSDSEADQEIKRKVRDAVNKEISAMVEDLTSIEEARALIKSRLPEIHQLAEQVLQEENVDQSVKTEFGQVDFPTKLYGEFLYPAGKYEAILITIGEGKGANWWCVLFPPLCFLDFSNGVAVSEGFDEETEEEQEEKAEEDEKEEKEDPLFVEEEEEEVEVKFFLFEIFADIFG